MSLYFPKGLKGKCIRVNYESDLGRFTSMIPLVYKIIEDNGFNKEDILICEYWIDKQKLRYFWGNIYIQPTHEIEALRVSRDDRSYFIFFIEDEDIKQQLLDYISSGGLNG